VFKFVVATVLVLSCCASSWATSYAIKDLGVLSRNGSSYAYSINDAGQVAGTAYNIAQRHPNGTSQAFRYQSGALSGLGTLIPGNLGQSLGFGINNAGDVVGLSWAVSTPLSHPMLHRNGTNQDLGTLGGDYGIATSINAAGKVVGHAYDADGRTLGFAFSGGSITGVGPISNFTRALAINNSDQIVGDYRTPEGFDRAFLHENGTWRDLGTPPSAFPGSSSAADINNFGVVAGWSQENRFAKGRAMTWHNEEWTELGVLPTHDSSEAYAINDLGDVVGRSMLSTSPSTTAKPFVYSDGQMIDVNTLVPAGSPFTSIIEVRDINNFGQMVGWGRVSYWDDTVGNTVHADHAFILSPVPEPATAGILAAATVVLSLRRTRRPVTKRA
jgi:probable HAF family extracellular repeat protein